MYIDKDKDKFEQLFDDLINGAEPMTGQKVYRLYFLAPSLITEDSFEMKILALSNKSTEQMRAQDLIPLREEYHAWLVEQMLLG